MKFVTALKALPETTASGQDDGVMVILNNMSGAVMKLEQLVTQNSQVLASHEKAFHIAAEDMAGIQLALTGLQEKVATIPVWEHGVSELEAMAGELVQGGPWWNLLDPGFLGALHDILTYLSVIGAKVEMMAQGAGGTLGKPLSKQWCKVDKLLKRVTAQIEELTKMPGDEE